MSLSSGHKNGCGYEYVLGIDIGASTSEIAYAKTSDPYSITSDYNLNRSKVCSYDSGFHIQSAMWRDPKTENFYLMRPVKGMADEELDKR